MHRGTTLAAALLTGLAACGCRGTNPCGTNPNGAGSAPGSRLPAPAAGSAWRVVGREGALRASGLVPPGGLPVLWIDPSGRLGAHLPASAETQGAGAALAPGTFGSLEVRSGR